MTRTTRFTPEQATAEEIIALIERGERVIVERDFFGEPRKTVMRYRDGVYYCDTGVKLLTRADVDEFQTCLRKHRLIRPEQAEEPEEAGLSA